MNQTPRPPPPAALERIGRYRIVRPLSKGGMALVYEARRESLAGVSPRVAIKLILPEYTDSDTFQQLFINEARLGASMQHQNLVQIQDFDRDGERFFLVMEYVEGVTLRRAISLCRKGRVHIPMGVIAEVGRQACDGLEYAHSATDDENRSLGLVHRDVKPSNLILNPQGVVKLVDFGISKGLRMVEKHGTVKGTWGYMSPEQAHGEEVGAGTDVFGLAVVLFEMAAKRPMFPDKSPDTVKRLLADDHPARMAATLDPSYRALMGPMIRALHRDPTQRYQKAVDFGRDLSALLPDPISARDAVVRFYAGVSAMHQGLPAPEGTLNTEASEPGMLPSDSEDSASSIGRDAVAAVARGISEPEPTPVVPMVALGLGVITLAAVCAVGGWMISQGDMLGASTPVEASLHEIEGVTSEPDALPVDEPAGPAGAGAPGEDTPPPVPERRAPPEPVQEAAPAERAPPTPRQAPAERLAPTPEPAEVTAAAEIVEVEEAAEPVPRVVVVRRPEPEVTEPEPAETPAVEAPAATGPGFLTVGARQPAEVYIDGRFVRRVPLVRRELAAGTHVITIQALDGRKKTFEVTTEAGEELRRVWDFDRGEWRP